MGWIAINQDQEILREDEHGRPVQAGEEGSLKFILQEDFGHKVGIDLINGVIVLDYSDWEILNGDVQLYNPRAVMYICDETTIVGELLHVDVEDSEVDGYINQSYRSLTWRPIWFTRYTNGVPTKIIGAQTTTPKEYGGKNIKKMISIFATGAIGID